jgi:hypothetical protein
VHPRALFLLPLLLPACAQSLGGAGAPGDERVLLGGGDDDDAAVPPGPWEVRCEASATAVELAPGEGGALHFEAIATWDDGSEGPAEGATWRILDGFGGGITGQGVYTAPADHGGHLRVEVEWETLTDTCEIDLVLVADVDLTGDPDLAAALLDALDTAAIDPSCAPLLEYPLAGSTLPRDLPAPTAQWQPNGAQDVFVLSYQTPWARLRVTTDQRSANPGQAAWRALTAAQNGEELGVTVLGGTWDGVDVQGLCGAPVAARVGAIEQPGAVYYWSPSTAGLWRIVSGSDVAESWLTPASTGWCVGCHTVNLANPERMAMNFGGGDQWSVVGEVDDLPSTSRGPEQERGNFQTLDPTGRYLARSYQGQLWLEDLATGAQLGALPTTGYASHPDWSPDGTRIVYSSCAGASDWMDWVVHQCGLRVMALMPDGQVVGDEQLVPSLPGWNHYYPAWSPDSAWIVFNRSTGDAYDDPDATLMLVRADGGDPVPLARASGVGDLANSWPRWVAGDEHEAWITFSSRRRYGHATDGLPQVWLAHLDLDEASSGWDPSAPPVWLPGQDPTTGNHTPVWVPRYTAE